MRKELYIAIAWMIVFTGSWTQSADAQQIQIVTDLGNVFVAEQASEEANNSGQGGGGVFGNSGTFRTLDLAGQVIHGQGMTGKANSLKSYTEVDPPSDFAAVVLDDDKVVAMSIPEFTSEYRYNSESLEQIKVTKPNIMSFAKSRTVQGKGTVTNGDELVFSGNGVIIAKLNDVGGKSTFLKGDIPSGTIRLVESPYDLMNLPYENGKGFKVDETSKRSDSTISSVRESSGGRGWCCVYWMAYTVQANIPTSAAISSEKNFYGEFDYNTSWGYWQKYYKGFSKGYEYRWISQGSAGTSNLTPVGAVDSDGLFKLKSAYFQYGYTSKQYSFSLSGTAKIYDKGVPAKDILRFSHDFEQPFVFPSGKDLYMVAEPKGGTIRLKAEGFDPAKTVFFKVTDLPPNAPYEVVKNNLVGTRGMTSPSGQISLTANSVDLLNDISPGGILKIYPDSMSYRGSFSTAVFDTINDKTLHIDDGHDRAYTAFAYVRLPFSVDAQIDKVSVGNTAISYLDGKYQAGDAIYIPILPNTDKITMNVNGISATLRLQDLPDVTGGKPIPPVTADNSDFNADGSLASISADAGSAAFAVATDQGRMYAMVTMSVSGNSAFSQDVSLHFTPNPPPPPPPRDPLSVYVDVYKNGELVKSEMVYYDDKPIFTPLNALNGMSIIQATDYHYSQRTVSAMTLVDVQPGDFVEFFVRTHIYAEGIPIPYSLVPQSSGGTYSIDKVVSAATATAKIHHGSILTAMA